MVSNLFIRTEVYPYINCLFFKIKKKKTNKPTKNKMTRTNKLRNEGQK